MSTRSLLFVAALSLALIGLAYAQETPPASTPPGESTTQSANADEQFVKDTLAKVKPFDPASADEAENALVERGKTAKFLRHDLKAALRAAIKDGKGEQITPIMDALLRIQLKYDPRKEIIEYVKKQPKWKDENVEARVHPQAIMSEDTGQNYSDTAFYLVRFRMFPVARIVQPPLAPSNIFIVNIAKKAGKEPDVSLTLVTDTDGLKDFVAKSGLKVADEDKARSFTKAWLRLSQEFASDGMMQFTIADDAVTAKKNDDGTITATGKATVAGGGQGELEATLTFDKDGKLSDVKETRNIKVGMRPKCQARKLLDKDEVVRYMARQSLLIMGTDAHDYMFEVHAAASPELKKAIDDVWEEILRDKKQFHR